MKKFKLILMALICAVSVGFVGCDKDGDNSSNDNDDNSSNSSTSTVSWSKLKGIWVESEFVSTLAESYIDCEEKELSKNAFVNKYSGYSYSGLRISSSGAVNCIKTQITSSWLDDSSDQIAYLTHYDGFIFWMAVDSGTDYGTLNIVNDCFYQGSEFLYSVYKYSTDSYSYASGKSSTKQCDYLILSDVDGTKTYYCRF